MVPAGERGIKVFSHVAITKASVEVFYFPVYFSIRREVTVPFEPTSTLFLMKKYMSRIQRIKPSFSK